MENKTQNHEAMLKAYNVAILEYIYKESPSTKQVLYFVGTLLNCNEIIDDKMGIMGLNSLPIPFKLSFNTLLMKGIIKEL